MLKKFKQLLHEELQLYIPAIVLLRLSSKPQLSMMIFIASRVKMTTGIA